MNTQQEPTLKSAMLGSLGAESLHIGTVPKRLGRLVCTSFLLFSTDKLCFRDAFQFLGLKPQIAERAKITQSCSHRLLPQRKR